MKSKLYLTLAALILVSCYSEGDSEDGFFAGSVDYIEVPTGDNYSEFADNPFIKVSENPTSTFSVDADGASYSNLRRFIFDDNIAPPPAAIRIEEMMNYFDLDYQYIENEHPISIEGEITSCPWNDNNKLIRIGIEGEPLGETPSSNYVFLIDVSGSMSSEDKLELLKSGFISVLDEMKQDDRIAIVTYAGSAGVVLNSTPVSEKEAIISAISRLGSGGSTAGAEGIITAYEIAEENFIEDGNNRIIIGTDGDFNVGPSSTDELVSLIEEKRESGIYLTVIGVGRGNLNDNGLEQIANNGNGTYEYVDGIPQLKKVFIYDFNKFFTVAKDVKVQVTFNPVNVASYRLIGYENRVLNNEDFEDDDEDAGEIGADQNITALYEIVPIDRELANADIGQLMLRYKEPNAKRSQLLEHQMNCDILEWEKQSNNFRWSAAIAAYAMRLRNSPHRGATDYTLIKELAESAIGDDPYGYRTAFLHLLQQSRSIGGWEWGEENPWLHLAA